MRPTTSKRLGSDAPGIGWGEPQPVQGGGCRIGAAAEVRLLAQRSAEAAKQIKGLIEDSVARVGQGNQQAEQAGTTMGEIVGSVQQLADLLAGIRSASQDQHAGIAQVNQTIVQMEANTQRNASLVEEAGAWGVVLQVSRNEFAARLVRH